MSISPLQLAFYKGVTGNWGAIQFNLQRPHFYVKSNPKLKNFEGKFIKDEWKMEYPNLTKDELVSREGALFLEITSAKGKNVYDWDNKIIMALSITDLSKMLEVLEGRKPDCSLMHDPGAKTASQGKIQKRLVISSPKGIREAGCLVSASMIKSGTGADPTKHTVPLSPDETLTLAVCIRRVIPRAIAW